MSIIKKYAGYIDREVIEKILNGETQLYELIIRRYNPFLYRIGRSYNYSHHDTEDLMQETYINAFYGLSKYEGKSSFKTWVTRIMLNNCYQKKQKSSFKNEMVTDQTAIENSIPMFQNHTNTEKSVINKELGHVLENALNNIPENYRLVFTLRELNGLSVAETSELINLTEANVKTRLNRAKNMLKAQIEEMYSPSEIYEFNLVYCDQMVNNVMTRILSGKRN